MHTGNQSGMKHSQKFDTGGSALICLCDLNLLLGGQLYFRQALTLLCHQDRTLEPYQDLFDHQVGEK
jgi:hypothetical protein